jgi:hypothetical protein
LTAPASTWRAVAGLIVALVTAGAGCGGGGATPSDGGTGGSGGAMSDVHGSGGADGGANTDGPGGDVPVLAAANLGKPCTATAACGAGLICLLPTDTAIFGSGGPANGYCTAACTSADVAAACTAANGTCTNMGPDMNTPQVYCLRNCTHGMAGRTGKCLSRPEVACTRLTASDGGVGKDVCIPTCSQDSDCPTGRVCDEATSVCVATQSAGAALGTHCEPTGTTTTCAGRCLRIGSGTVVTASFCSRRCVFGNLNSCNWVGTGMSLATGGAHGVCVLSGADSDTGDQGYCAQLCDSVADCADKADPGLSCDTTGMMTVQHGICFFGSGGADGGTDASSDGPADQAPGN